MDAVDNSPIIRLFHVHKRYGSKNALIDTTLDISKNEFICISGPSGAGKTTLLKLLYLGEPVSEGQVLVDGMNLSRIPSNRIHLLRRKFGIIFQDYKLIPTKTVFENVALVLEVMGKKRGLIRKKVRSVLRTVEMEERHDSLPPSLSGGEQQRIAIARAVVGDPRIILADEPTGNLDDASADVIFDLLKGFHARGGTIIVATHDKELIRKAGGRTVYLRQGRVEKITNA
ncbi:MAG: cell division ATP-binding protein FtsE [Thermodesulfobacteriota bacterium]